MGGKVSEGVQRTTRGYGPGTGQQNLEYERASETGGRKKAGGARMERHGCTVGLPIVLLKNGVIARDIETGQWALKLRHLARTTTVTVTVLISKLPVGTSLQ